MKTAYRRICFVLFTFAESLYETARSCDRDRTGRLDLRNQSLHCITTRDISRSGTELSEE